eukprot:350015-Chlamydomonas_euryale.AAC.12
MPVNDRASMHAYAHACVHACPHPGAHACTLTLACCMRVCMPRLPTGSRLYAALLVSPSPIHELHGKIMCSPDGVATSSCFRYHDPVDGP